MYQNIREYMVTTVGYYDGRREKGTGNGTKTGYNIELVPQYMDVMVAWTNMYNNCDLDYLMQAFGRYFTSVSGFLDFAVNFFMWRFISDTDAILYTNLSSAIENGNKE